MKKPDTERKSHLYVGSKKVKAESRQVATRGMEVGETGRYCSKGTKL